MRDGKKISPVTLAYFLLSPAVLFFAMEWFLRNPFHEKWGMKPSLMVINLVFFYLLEAFLLGLTGKLREALYIEWGFALFTGLIDHYIYRFRGSTIVPWDFFSLGTALSVADNFSFKPERTTVIILIIFLFLAVLFFFCRFSVKKNTRLRIALSAISLILFFFAYIPFVQSEKTIKRFKVYDKLFTPDTMTMRDGMVFAFIYDLKFLKINKPDGYDKDEIRSALYREYGGEDKETAFEAADEDTPNIIVIMCEAFSDPAVLADFQTNEDFMPCIRSLMKSEDTISGYLHVSVLGGNTPNTEYEFLTGNTMAFLPEGSIPFQQFITGKIDAMPRFLKERGYNTMAMHPYRASGWDRERVYPLLGFDRSYFLPYFTERDPFYIRKYVSDETLFKEIINAYQENGKETPFFSFNVTMQNHSEYSGDLNGFEPGIFVDGFEEDNLINRYLSLERATDDAFRDLIFYFNSIKDPTLIVFFGDHQPADRVVEPIWNLAGKEGKSLSDEDIRRRYEVPYLIWANYDIDGVSDHDTSANFLGNMVLEAAGAQLKGYRAFLKEEEERKKVITAIHTIDADGTDRDTDKDSKELLRYKRMQYYQMFDDEDTLD